MIGARSSRALTREIVESSQIWALKEDFMKFISDPKNDDILGKIRMKFVLDDNNSSNNDYEFGKILITELIESRA
jgi:hypothetical protein